MYPLYKVKEAKYFMEQLRGIKIASEAFCFNFSALLSAARSITFTIQKLYKHQDGFELEYEKLREKLKLLPFAKEIVESRNVSEKEGHKVPLLITTTINLDTKDKITYECDPLPDDVNDVIRKIYFEYGNDIEGLIPADLAEEQKITLYMTQFHQTLKRMQESNNKATTYSIKLYEKGNDTTVDKFFEDMSRYLELLEEAACDYNSRCPSTTAFSGLGK